MRVGARRLALLLLGCSLLEACQAPRPPAAPAPPERELTICERPARPGAAAQDPQVEASFRAFAQAWLEKMRAAGSAENAPGGRKQIRDEFETELRPTRSALAPWVGVLRYCQQALRCAGASVASCEVSKSEAISEIFRFQAGTWMY